MEQLEFFTIPNPCVGVCTANSKGFCKGCLRSREERLYWHQMSDTKKRHVMRLLANRRNKLQNAAKGHQVTAALPEQMKLMF